MFKIFQKIKDSLLERKMHKICSNLTVSEKGTYLIAYLEDIVKGLDVYIESYEECLTFLMEHGLSRVEAAKFQLATFQVLKKYGTKNIDIDIDVDIKI